MTVDDTGRILGDGRVVLLEAFLVRGAGTLACRYVCIVVSPSDVGRLPRYNRLLEPYLLVCKSKFLSECWLADDTLTCPDVANAACVIEIPQAAPPGNDQAQGGESRSRLLLSADLDQRLAEV